MRGLIIPQLSDFAHLAFTHSVSSRVFEDASTRTGLGGKLFLTFKRMLSWTLVKWNGTLPVPRLLLFTACPAIDSWLSAAIPPLAFRWLLSIEVNKVIANRVAFVLWDASEDS
jgi:hypothetical protein